MKLSIIESHLSDLKKEYYTIGRALSFEEWLTAQCITLLRDRDESREQLKNAYDEINALRTTTKMCKEQLAELSEEKFQNTLLAQKCSGLADELNDAYDKINALKDDRFNSETERANEYLELAKLSTIIFRGIPRFELTALMSTDDFEKFKNHLGV